MTKIEYQNLLNKASRMTTERLAKTPSYGVYIHASGQLALMQSILDRAEGRPTEAEQKELAIGLMAAKELEASEPEYADILEQVDYYFSRWTKA